MTVGQSGLETVLNEVEKVTMKRLIAAVGGAGLALSLNANAGIVDLFSTNQTTIVSDTNGVGVSSQAGSGADLTILGGYRDLYAEAVVGADPGNSGTRIGVFSSDLNFSNDSGVQGFGEVVWDGSQAYVGPDGTIGGNIDTTVGLGGFDLTLLGTVNSFLLETVSSDANWNFEIIAFSGPAAWTRVNLAATSVPTGTGPVLSVIPFAAFTTPGLCGSINPAPGVNQITCAAGPTVVNLGSLTALQARLNVGTDGGSAGGAFDIDLRLANVTTVPEPATLGLMGLGLLATGFSFRRRNR
jgi:hypothetical protein